MFHRFVRVFGYLCGMIIFSCVGQLRAAEDASSESGESKIISLIVMPQSGVINVGDTLQYIALATYEDNTTRDVTRQSKWCVSNKKVAHISSDGFATGQTEGTTDICTSFEKLSTKVTLTVSGRIVSLSIVPSMATMSEGQSVDYHAIATYSNGTIKEVTDHVKWVSSKKRIASIGHTGKAVGLNEGSTRIRASFKKITSQAELTVSGKIASIQIFPTKGQLEQGVTRQYRAQAVYVDGSSQDITSQVHWSSSKRDVACIDSDGMATGIEKGRSCIQASFGGFCGKTKLTVLPEHLTSISISPKTNRLMIFESQQFLAVGTYDNGKTVDSDHGLSVTWHSSCKDKVSVDKTGIGLAHAPGSVKIIAISTHDKEIKGCAEVVVSEATLDSIAMKPTALTMNVQDTSLFEAKGHYSDGSTLSTKHGFSVTWNVDDQTAATVDSTGSVTSIKGSTSTNVVARAGSIVGVGTVKINPATLTRIIINPSTVNLVKGLQQQFSAQGIYSDGTSIDLTKEVIWISSDQTVATISNEIDLKGVVVAQSPGNTSIKATLGNVTGSATITVSPVTVTALDIIPSEIRLAQGMQYSFSARATYSDQSTADVTQSVIWDSSDEKIVCISNQVGTKGVITAQKSGNASIIATFDEVKGYANITVLPSSISSVVINPSGESVIIGKTKSFTATAIYDDLTTADVTQVATWLLEDNGFEIDSPGLVRSLKQGHRSNLTASIGSIVSVPVTVTMPQVSTSKIVILPNDMSVMSGFTQQFTATMTCDNGNSSDITNEALWSVDDQTVAGVSELGNGIIEARNGGTTTISASYLGALGSSTLTSSSTITNITIEPSIVPSILVGQDCNLRAKAHYSDGSLSDVTGRATWTSTNPCGVNVPLGGGVVVAENQGATASISASVGGVTSQNPVQITVDNATITSIEVSPSTASLNLGEVESFTVQASYDNGSKLPIIANNLAWGTDNCQVAVYNGSGTFAGGSLGTALIFARFEQSGNATFEVTNSISSIDVSALKNTCNQGETVQCKATATYQDGSHADISKSVVWSSNDETVATVDHEGVITGTSNRASSSAIVSASFQGLTDSVPITVTDTRTITSITILPQDLLPPPYSITLHESRQFTAIATWSDTTTQDISHLVTWSTEQYPGSPSNVIILYPEGFVYGNIVGKRYLVATYNLNPTLSNRVEVTVVD